MYKKIEYKGNTYLIISEIVVSLPTTFTDYQFFIESGSRAKLLDVLGTTGILGASDVEEFKYTTLMGHFERGGVTYESYAIWLPGLEQYHIVGYTTKQSHYLIPDKKLFRFHGGGTIYESMKHVFEIRDFRELKNIIRARDLILEDQVLEVKPHAFDSRINWATYLVIVDGNGIGYTNHPVYIPKEGK